MNDFSFLEFFLKKKSISNVFLLNDHKTGFTLTGKITNIINRNSNVGIHIRTFYLFWNNYKKKNKYIIIVRHPKEIIISSYLYHKQCREEWALKQDGYYYSFWEESHFEVEAVIKNKVNLDKAKSFSSPIPYQEKLNLLPQNEGIIYEMNSVSKLTIDGMYNLKHYKEPNTFIVKNEDLIFNHDDTIQKLCDFLNINKRCTKKIIAQCLEHNLLSQKKNNQLTSHATNVNVEKDRYKQYWNEIIEEEFNKLFPADVLSKFGYI